MSAPVREGYGGHDLNVIVGRRVHRMMWDRRETQTGLARILGIKQHTLGRKLRGERDFDLNELAAVADHFGVEIGWLVRRPDDSDALPQGDGCAVRDSNPEPSDLKPTSAGNSPGQTVADNVINLLQERRRRRHNEPRSASREGAKQWIKNQ